MNQKGQILVIVFIALGVVLFSVLSVIAGAQIYYQNSFYNTEAEQAVTLAEAGVDKAIASLNKTGGNYNGEGEVNLGTGSYTVGITSQDAATKIIESTGYIPNKASSRAKRIIKITASRGVGASFVYGVQVGEGGLQLGNSNEVTGTVYSNGNITGQNNNSISGDVWVAGGPQPTADQQTDCTGSNCADFVFGTTVNGQSQLDSAQCFVASSSGVLNKISLKLRKIGNPPDETVRILADSNGQPDKNQVLTTGTLYSNLASTNYGWIDVAFASLPSITKGVPYWIMIDTSLNSSNYWSWQNDLAKSYSCGNPDLCLAKWSTDWQAKSPTWNLINGDLSLQAYMGGSPTSISGGNSFIVGGNVHAHGITNLTIRKDAYYQTISNTTAAHFYPNSADPPPKPFPLSDANITDWKAQAQQGIQYDTINSCPSSLGPGKVNGSVTINSNCIVVIKHPLWITGDLTLNSNNILKLDPSYGTSAGAVLVDGKITLGSNNDLQGTGIGSSILVALSNFDSRPSPPNPNPANAGVSAIVLANTGNSGVFYADKGIIEPGNHNEFKELTGWGIKLVNNSEIVYQTGLSSTLFSSGPSGTYSLVKGTYQVR